jgi:hypothetical protein
MTDSFEFVIWYEQIGAHTHMTFFVSRRGHTRGKSGDLIMNNEEFAAFRKVCEAMKFGFVEKKRVRL